MRTEETIIRAATVADAAALLEIYAPYVQHTAISFEQEPPELAEFQRRMQVILQKYPYLVAEGEGRVLGYAYASAFVDRAAYDRTADVTIYLAKTAQGLGLGRRLYTVLEALCKAQGILNLTARIGYPAREDAHLTRNSAQFHEHLGFSLVGRFHQCGYKFDTWYDMVSMEKLIGPHCVPPAPLVRCAALSQETLRAAGVQRGDFSGS